MKRSVVYILSILILFLNACGGGGGSSSDDGTFSLAEKQFVYNLFLTEYLWYDQVASNVDYATFTSPEVMIDTLRVNPPDLWSFTITEAEYEDFANQKTVGFGFGYERSSFTIYLVRIDAPAYGKLLRGDIILEVNGKAATETLISEASANENVQTTFRVLRGTEEVDVTLTSQAYTFKVSLGTIIEEGGNTVGYLRYDSFTETSVSEFETVFTNFKAAGVNELVIDLRYNGGGSVATASALLDNIINTKSSQRQFYLDWNANYKQENSSYYFEGSDMQDGNELNMNRVFFLVTKDSASASEAVISALKPYLGASNVITVGDLTHGKPVGMRGRVYGNNYYFLINFLVKNNANVSTSFDGIPVTCSAEDDLTHLMGDANETMLRTALDYINTGACP